MQHKQTILAVLVFCPLISACDVRSKRIEVPIVPDGPNRLRYYEESVPVVDIDLDGAKTIGALRIQSDSAMRDILTELKAGNPYTGIGIHADARAPFEAVSTVMLLANSAGFSDIFVAVGEKGRTESGEPITVERDIRLHLK